MRQDEIRTWICQYVARLLARSADGIDLDAPFDRLGLDSASAVALIGDLEDWLDVELSPVAAYDHPTIRTLSAYLATISAKSASFADAAG